MQSAAEANVCMLLFRKYEGIITIAIPTTLRPTATPKTQAERAIDWSIGANYIVGSRQATWKETSKYAPIHGGLLGWTSMIHR